MFIFTTVLLLLCALVSAAPQSSASASASTSRNSTKCALARSGLSAAQSFDKFVDTLFNKRDANGARAHMNPGYINHNPYSTDGAEAALSALTMSKYLNSTFGFMNVRGPASGNPVGMLHYKLTYPDFPISVAVVDIFRMDGPCVAEHWDVSQTLPPNVTSSHPLFSEPLAPKIKLPTC